MTAPATRVLTLVAGMAATDRAVAAAASSFDGYGPAEAAPEAGTVGVGDPNRAARIAALAGECGGQVVTSG